MQEVVIWLIRVSNKQNYLKIFNSGNFLRKLKIRYQDICLFLLYNIAIPNTLIYVCTLQLFVYRIYLFNYNYIIF